MRILHINSNHLYTTLHDHLIQRLEALGLDNDVFMPHHGNNAFAITPSEAVHHPVCFKQVDRFFFHRKQKKIWNCLTDNIVLAHDVTHAHTLFTDGNIALKIKRAYGTPYVVTVRNTDVNVFFRYLAHLRRLGYEILQEASRVVFLSRAYQELVLDQYAPPFLRRVLAEKAIVIPNGIDSYWLDNRPETKPRRGCGVRLITAGLICNNKNQLTVCRAIELLQKKGLEVEYLVVGNVKEPRIMAMLDDYAFVKRLPFVPKESLVEHYRDSDIFVMPSRTESFGLAYAEAMSQGLPVVYSIGQGFDSQFEEGVVGYHVEYDNPMHIATAVLAILDNYDAISRNCISLSRTFDWSQIAPRIEIVYQKAIEDKQKW